MALQGEYGLEGLALSIPAVVGRGGIEKVLEIPLAPNEQAALLASARQLLKAMEACPCGGQAGGQTPS